MMQVKQYLCSHESISATPTAPVSPAAKWQIAHVVSPTCSTFFSSSSLYLFSEAAGALIRSTGARCIWCAYTLLSSFWVLGWVISCSLWGIKFICCKNWVTLSIICAALSEILSLLFANSYTFNSSIIRIYSLALSMLVKISAFISSKFGRAYRRSCSICGSDRGST